AVLLHGNGHKVALWGRLPAEVDPILAAGENKAFLPGVKIPKEILVTLDAKSAVRGAELVVLAVPSHGMRPICQQVKQFLPPGLPLVSVAKGIENETGARMSEVITDVLETDRIIALSGPSHAEEVGRGIPTAVVVAAKDPALATATQKVFMNERFRIYTHDDIIGVELGGALKNVIAIAAGACDGIGFGDNTKAALCTRGLAEMTRLGVALGARRDTFFGLSGVGDLIVTAFSHHSRNRGFGERLGRGETPEQIAASTPMVAEGVKTAKSAWQVARRLGVDVPITSQVYAIIYEGKAPKQAVRDLMTREAKPEFGSCAARGKARTGMAHASSNGGNFSRWSVSYTRPLRKRLATTSCWSVAGPAMRRRSMIWCVVTSSGRSTSPFRFSATGKTPPRWPRTRL
ncbi:MAG TPA: NAD(P)H-dependent glycerol-3-phosphate dehydrogenase, partial [Mycobacterium sp.]|nr:NAD(P)H-dependent glycerol-3-phosphate dehydrogenase [Mycobacterium sp.]